MKCEHCGKNEVTFVYQSNINGEVTEKNLCGACAEQLGYTQEFAVRNQRMMRNFDSLFDSDMFNDFFSPTTSMLSRIGSMLEDPFDDFFADMPALGAPVQEAKQEKQEELIEREEQEQLSRMRQINALKMEQQKAVQEENFERAAELRDQIRELEKIDQE